MNTPKFTPGEIAVIIAEAKRTSHLGPVRGCDVEIIATPGTVLVCPACKKVCCRPEENYTIHFPDGTCVSAPEYVLGKKRPPIPPDVLKHFESLPAQREEEPA